MRLVIFRHGPAGDRDPIRWPDDRLRPLTPRGEERTREACGGIARLEPALTLVFTSPLARSQRTAECLAEAAGLEGAVHEMHSLEPGGSWRRTLAELAKLDAEATVALVGHEPDLGKLVGVLLLGAPAALPLKKAGACALEFDGPARGGEGALRWFLPPRLLRRLARRSSKV